MKGLVDAIKGKGAPGMTAEETPPAKFGEQETASTSGGDMSAMLDSIQANVEKKVPDSLRKDYLAILLAGRQLMYSPQTHQEMVNYLGTIRSPQDIAPRVSHGVLKVISIIANELAKKGKKFPAPAAGPAAISLMCAALKYVEGQLNIDLTTGIIDQTTQMVVRGFLALFKIDQAKMRQAFEAVTPPGKQMGEGFQNEARTPEEASKEAEPAPKEAPEEEAPEAPAVPTEEDEED
jgi:hypothetical protein